MQPAPESRHALGTDLPLPLTVSMRRGHLILHTVVFLAGFAVLLSRLHEQRHVFPPHWVVLICVVSAVLLAMTRIVILRHEGILVRRVLPIRREIPYGDVRKIAERGQTVRLTLSDGDHLTFQVTLPEAQREQVLDWLRGQVRAAPFD